MICFDCLKEKTRLVRGPSESWVCENKNCWAYIDVSQIESWRVDKQGKIFALREMDLSERKIAKEIERSKTTVHYWLKK